jgi:hypothetical protein
LTARGILQKEVIMDRRILKNEFLQIEYLTNSLRIIGLTPTGKTNMFADLSNFPPIATPYGDFYFRGGHRLWHSPEAMPRTYIPDTAELMITDQSDGVILEARTESGTGIRKRIEIHLVADQSSVILTHTLINDGLWPVELAPWAITQLRLGGTVILPMLVGNADPAGLLPNRQFSLWPYAHISDPRLKLDDKFVLFKADAMLPPFKMGYFNSHGWMAYWLDGILFRKTFIVNTELSHPDNNCNSEIYCNDQFIELESLAPLIRLSPGASVNHRETWDVFYKSDTFPEEVREALVAS